MALGKLFTLSESWVSHLSSELYSELSHPIRKLRVITPNEENSAFPHRFWTLLCGINEENEKDQGRLM